jgi:cytochrome c553
VVALAPAAVIAALVVVLVAALAPPPAAAQQPDRLATCLACHGAGGTSMLPETPSLGGQPTFYLLAQLVMFREGRRANAVMTEMAKPLTNNDVRALSEAITKLAPPEPPGDAADPARMARAQTLARQRHCPVCHNPDYSGREQMARLANQREDYLLKVMREFRAGTRIGYGGTMIQELVGLSDADLADLAHYLSRLPRTR